jgi:Sir2 family
MIPPFYAGASQQSPATYTTNGKPRSFDAEVEELIQLIKAGEVAIFCGAGISIASGIPSAKTLQRALLNRLPASELEAMRLVENDLPFEAFMEVLSKTTNLELLLDVFVGKEPTAAHILLADLVTRGSVPTIATTNFDELIERAAGSTPVAVTKLHGTISDPRSIAVTMEVVAGRQQLPDREQAIRDLFADGGHAGVLVTGYSCSDAFDITPAIEVLGDSLKRVWIVEHEPHAERAEDIIEKPSKNPFRRCRNGTRLFCDTDALFARIARELATPNYQCTSVTARSVNSTAHWTAVGRLTALPRCSATSF